MKHMKKYWFLALIGLATLFACKDEDEFVIGKNIILNDGESRAWGLVSVTENGTDATAKYISECQSDDVITFLSNENFTIDEGTVKCGESQKSGEGIWRISDDNKEFYLLLTGNATAIEGTVTSLSNSTLSFSQVINDVTVSWTYQAK